MDENWSTGRVAEDFDSTLGAIRTGSIGAFVWLIRFCKSLSVLRIVVKMIAGLLNWVSKNPIAWLYGVSILNYGDALGGTIGVLSFLHDVGVDDPRVGRFAATYVEMRVGSTFEAF